MRYAGVFFRCENSPPKDGQLGQLDPKTLEAPLSLAKGHAPHTSRPKVISISQSTEVGTVYRPESIKSLRHLCDQQDLYLHMDGARLGNAIASLGLSPAEVTWRAGVDLLSFGGTKCGGLLCEAIVFFNPDHAKDFAFRHKRAGQLASKSRFIAAQLLALLQDDLWLSLCHHANQMAQHLAQGIAPLTSIKTLYPVEANALFVTMSDALCQSLRQQGHEFYEWPLEGPGAYRLVTSWMSTPKTSQTLSKFAAPINKV